MRPQSIYKRVKASSIFEFIVKYLHDKNRWVHQLIHKVILFIDTDELDYYRIRSALFARNMELNRESF